MRLHLFGRRKACLNAVTILYLCLDRQHVAAPVKLVEYLVIITEAMTLCVNPLPTYF